MKDLTSLLSPSRERQNVEKILKIANVKNDEYGEDNCNKVNVDNSWN